MSSPPENSSMMDTLLQELLASVATLQKEVNKLKTMEEESTCRKMVMATLIWRLQVVMATALK